MGRNGIKKQFWLKKEIANELESKAKKACLTETAMIRMLITGYNLLCCDETNDRANIIKSVLEQIAEVLVQQGFDRELFLLYKPRTFEPEDILDLEDALEVADRYMNNIELCTEIGDAYIFSNHRIDEKETEGGPEPVIILKRGGKRVSCLDYNMDKEKLGLRQEDHEIIDEYSICFR